MINSSHLRKAPLAIPLSAALLLNLSSARAAPESEEIFFAEIEPVVTVTRLPQSPVEVPASVTVIDRRLIEASGALNLPDLLRVVAGFQVGHVDGSRSTVTYHGMSDEYSRRMQVLVDGRSVYMPDTGGVDWFDLPVGLDEIARIEVIRGPNGVTYGANSFLGIINIITFDASETRGGKMQGISGGGSEVRRGGLRFGGQAGSLSYRVSGWRDATEGFADAANQNGDLVAQRDDKSISAFNFRGDYRSGVNDYLSFQAGNSTGRQGGGFATNPVTEPAHEIDTRHFFGQVKWRRILGSDSDLETQLYVNGSDNSGSYKTQLLSQIFSIAPADVPLYFNGNPDQQVVIPRDLSSRRYDLEMQHRTRLGESVRAVWGAEARLDQVTSPILLGLPGAIEHRLYRLFGNGEWMAGPAWRVNIGAMVENNDITGSSTSPRVALNYLITPRDSIRLSYTEAFRTPVILEQYADYGPKLASGTVIDQIWKSAGGLRPERITSLELGFSGQSNDGVHSYDVKIYQERLQDLIATPVDHAFQENFSALCAYSADFCAATVFVNNGHADIHGLDLQWRSQGERFLASLGYSLAIASGSVMNNVNPNEFMAVDQATPRDTASLLIGYRWPHELQTSVGIYHAGDMEFFSAGSPTGGYTTADVTVSQPFRGGGIKGRLFASARDILGTYHDFFYFNRLEPRAYLGLDLEF